MISFYSHGKLLLTGEYTILKGANALAIPCKMGQTLIQEIFNDKGMVLSASGTWKILNLTV